MLHKIISVLLCFLMFQIGLIIPFPSWAQEKESYNIAVLDLIANGISETEALSLSDNMRGKFAEIATSEKFNKETNTSYTLVERSQMDKIFDEFDVQNTGCTDISCAIEFGKMLNVERIVIGSIGLVGETYSIQARIVDVETSKILVVSNEIFKGPRDNLLTTVIPGIVHELMYGRKLKKSKKLYYIIGGVVLAGGIAAAVLSGGGSGSDSAPRGSEGTALIDIIIDDELTPLIPLSFKERGPRGEFGERG